MLRMIRVIVLVSFAACLFTGCATVKIPAYSSNKFHKYNPIKKIAIITYGSILDGDNSKRKNKTFISIEKSKLILSKVLQYSKKIIINKGYEIVFCEIIGIGYPGNNKAKLFIIDKNEGSSSVSNELPIDINEYAYEYEILSNNNELKTATSSIIKLYEDSVSNSKWPPLFNPSSQDISILKDITKADTIIIHRIFGIYYSPEYRSEIAGFGGLIGGVAAAMATANELEYAYVIIDANSNEQIWINGEKQLFVDFDKIPETFFSKALQSFPEINTPMNEKYLD